MWEEGSEEFKEGVCSDVTVTCEEVWRVEQVGGDNAITERGGGLEPKDKLGSSPCISA